MKFWAIFRATAVSRESEHEAKRAPDSGRRFHGTVFHSKELPPAPRRGPAAAQSLMDAARAKGSAVDEADQQGHQRQPFQWAKKA